MCGEPYERVLAAVFPAAATGTTVIPTLINAPLSLSYPLTRLHSRQQQHLFQTNQLCPERFGGKTCQEVELKMVLLSIVGFGDWIDLPMPPFLPGEGLRQ